jgi:hypothetical protein
MAHRGLLNLECSTNRYSSSKNKFYYVRDGGCDSSPWTMPLLSANAVEQLAGVVAVQGGVPDRGQLLLPLR